MKTRNDFVSNSSSSSFICVSGDLDKICVYGEVDYYGVRRYVETHWRRDVFGDWGSPAESQPRFEPDEKYAANFGSNSCGSLPESAKAAYEKYRDAYVAAKGAASGEREAAWKKADALERGVADAVWLALEPKWKDVTLAEVTASDDDGDEESMYGEFGSLHDPAFYRTFNNH